MKWKIDLADDDLYNDIWRFIVDHGSVIEHAVRDDSAISVYARN